MRLSRLVAQPLECTMTPLHDYVTILSQLGGNTTLVPAPRIGLPTSANLIDEQTIRDEDVRTQYARSAHAVRTQCKNFSKDNYCAECIDLDTYEDKTVY